MLILEFLDNPNSSTAYRIVSWLLFLYFVLMSRIWQNSRTTSSLKYFRGPLLVILGRKINNWIYLCRETDRNIKHYDDGTYFMLSNLKLSSYSLAYLIQRIYPSLVLLTWSKSSLKLQYRNILQDNSKNDNIYMMTRVNW